MKSSSADCISSHNPPLAFVGYDLAISWRVLLSTVKSRGGHGTMGMWELWVQGDGLFTVLNSMVKASLIERSLS